MPLRRLFGPPDYPNHTEQCYDGFGLTANRVNGGGKAARSGAEALALLASPLNSAVLRSLADGPKQQVALRRECGMPAQTTLRAQMRKLEAAGTVDKRRRSGFPGGLDYELTAAGNELLQVVSSLERWLRTSPDGGMEFGDRTATAAIKALAAAWSTGILRALAAGAVTLTELSGLIPSLSYPTLERRLAALRLANLISAREGNGRGTPYGLRRWGREAVGSIVSALRWERRHMPESTPQIHRVDVETAFLMGVPLLAPSPELSGSCRMTVDLGAACRDHGLCGVVVSAQEGRITSCMTKLEGCPDAWASGSATDWLAAVIDGELGALEIGGDSVLARQLTEGLHRSLLSLKSV